MATQQTQAFIITFDRPVEGSASFEIRDLIVNGRPVLLLDAIYGSGTLQGVVRYSQIQLQQFQSLKASDGIVRVVNWAGYGKHLTLRPRPHESSTIPLPWISVGPAPVGYHDDLVGWDFRVIV